MLINCTYKRSYYALQLRAFFAMGVARLAAMLRLRARSEGISAFSRDSRLVAGSASAQEIFRRFGAATNTGCETAQAASTP